METPARIQAQYQEMLSAPGPLSREECERRWPELIAWVLDNVSLPQILHDYGFQVHPLSPDAPNVLIGDILVKD